MTRPRLIVGLAIPIALALAIALVLLTHHEATAPAPATVASATPSTTQPAKGGQWLPIMRQILDFRHSLFENPRPELLREIYDPGCPCYAQELRQLEDLRRKGLRYNDRGTEVEHARLIGRARDPSKPIAAIEVTSRQFAQVLVNSNGNVVQQFPATSYKKSVYELIRGSDGRWRVYLVYRA